MPGDSNKEPLKPKRRPRLPEETGADQPAPLPDQDGDQEEARPRRRSSRPATDETSPREGPARPQPRSRTPKAKEQPPAKPVDRGKWRGGTFQERLQRLRWIFHLLYRYAPVWLIVLILLAIFVPNLLRVMKKPFIIAPLYTPEVQYWTQQIGKWSAQYDVNPNLVATLMQIESCGYPGAASIVGAQGLFQVMPMHFSANENMTDPNTNALRGIGVIKECLNYADGDIGLAMACYNGGPSLINRDPATWPLESQHYYIWGTGIYNDAVRGKNESQSLQDWLQAGGEDLCREAATTLGLPTATNSPRVVPVPPTARPATPIPTLPAAPVTIQPQPTLPLSGGAQGTLPTFALPITGAP